MSLEEFDQQMPEEVKSKEQSSLEEKRCIWITMKILEWLDSTHSGNQNKWKIIALKARNWLKSRI